MWSGDKLTYFCSALDRANCYHVKWWQAASFCSVSDKADCYHVKWWQDASFLFSTDKADCYHIKWWPANSFLLSTNLTVLPWLLFTKVHSLALANFYVKLPGVLDHWIILHFNIQEILLHFTVFSLNTINIWHHTIHLSQPVPTILSLHSHLKLIKFLPHVPQNYPCFINDRIPEIHCIWQKHIAKQCRHIVWYVHTHFVLGNLTST